MPITKSAKKALRVSRRKTVFNRLGELNLKKVITSARKKADSENLSEAFRVLDTSVKKGIIHENKASRLKSKLAKGVKIQNQGIKKGGTKLQKAKLKASKSKKRAR